MSQDADHNDDIIQAAIRGEAKPSQVLVAGLTQLGSEDSLREYLDHALENGDKQGCITASLALAFTQGALSGDLFGSKTATRATTAALFVVAQVIMSRVEKAMVTAVAPGLPSEARLTAYNVALNILGTLAALSHAVDDVLIAGGIVEDEAGFKDNDLSKNLKVALESTTKSLKDKLPILAGQFKADPLAAHPSRLN